MLSKYDRDDDRITCPDELTTNLPPLRSHGQAGKAVAIEDQQRRHREAQGALLKVRAIRIVARNAGMVASAF
jgi:hypothetical protein